MAVYTSAQRSKDEKPAPTEGEHLMQIKIEKPNAKLQSQHSFLLVNDQHDCWFNCFVTELEDFAASCGVTPDANGNLDTSLLVGKKVKITYGKKMAKNGKEYSQVIAHAPAGVAAKPVDTSDITF